MGYRSGVIHKYVFLSTSFTKVVVGLRFITTRNFSFYKMPCWIQEFISKVCKVINSFSKYFVVNFWNSKICHWIWIMRVVFHWRYILMNVQRIQWNKRLINQSQLNIIIGKSLNIIVEGNYVTFLIHIFVEVNFWLHKLFLKNILKG